MKIFSTAASIAALMVATTGAATAQVSASGARDVQTTFETYLGKGSDGTSAVRVTTNGANDGYDVAIDVGRLAKPLEMMGATVKPALLTFVVKPVAGGTWAYSQTSFPTLSVTVPGSKVEFSTNGLVASGVFDPKLTAFSSYTATAKSVTSSNENASSKTTAETQDIKLSGGSTDAGGGLVDSKMSYVTGSVAETISGTAGTGATPPIRLSVASSALTGDAKGQPTRAMLDLWSFLVAHPTKEALTTDQAALKTRILAAIPVFKQASIAGSADNLIVETPMGNARISKIGLTETMNGVVPEGSFVVGVNLGAIEPPAALVPSWANGLIPKESILGVKLTGYNLDSYVRAVVAKLDLAAAKPLDMTDDESLAAILPGGKLFVELTPGKLSTDSYTLAWTGVIEVNPKSSIVSGKATISAKGLDKVAQQLSKSTDSMQYATALFAAKEMAKPVDGADVWELEFDSNGTFIVNGRKLGG